MKVFVVGGGGREHALVWKLSRDSETPDIFCAPGNAGTADAGTNVDIGAEDIDGLLAWAKKNRPDLTVVGPEAPLCAGLVDAFEAEGLRVFGPRRKAAMIEGSKEFSKEVMVAGGVPTARAGAFSDYDRAVEYISRMDMPVVVKADGLAAGKGVIICESRDEAAGAVREMLVDHRFKEAGNRVLVEECLEGEEVSVLGLVDGDNVVLLSSAQDHKRAFDDDAGPNTGGMGAYSPAPMESPEFRKMVQEQVFDRTLAELKKRGIEYKGVLYAGLMMTARGPMVLEFNCRFGDPEVQAIIPRLKGDLVPVLNACIDGNLKPEHVEWTDEHCVCVVMASGGYPGSYEKGVEINGLSQLIDKEDVVVFHAGTDKVGGKVVTSGGRVLGVTALGYDLAEAARKSYDAVSLIEFQNAHYRKDIAARGMKRA